MVRHARQRGPVAVGAAVCLVIGLAPPATAEESPDTTAELMAAVEDHCGDGGCRDILPPGQNGNATLVDILGHQLFGTVPEHADTQLEPYEDLLYGHEDLTGDALGDYFLDASFGVDADDIGAQYQPRDDVTVVRDRQHGIPHVYGTTRAGTMYGAGYAAAEDRLFLMDVLRNLGRGELTSFAGGAEGNRELEQQLWRGAPYTEEDKQAQIDRAVAEQGDHGEQALEDVEDYLDGINAYIDRSQKRNDYPGEYVLTGHKDPLTQAGEIEHFSVTDVVGMASMVGLLFGGGGGGEVESALIRASFQSKYGTEKGEELWRGWRMENDPEAVVTVDGDFPYSATPDDPVGEAPPDPDSVVPYDIVHDEQGSAAGGATAAPRPAARPDADTGTNDDLPESDREELGSLVEEGDLDPAEGIFNDGVLPGDLLEGEAGTSNAALVSAELTESGNPVSVMGPQTGYFSPQLLMLQELQGPGISARGASFPGVSFYVQMGRGVDYTWSATSAGQDITDTFAVELCEPDGSEPSTDSRAYVDGDSCVEFEELSVQNSWSPTVADQTPHGSYTLTALRSKYGLVDSFGTVDDKPVAFATRRSTYMREVDSIIGFQKFNDPDEVTSAEEFQSAAMDINYAFNWHYADADDIAFLNSGANPVRTEGTNPNLPIAAESAAGWSGWVPETNGADYTPLEEHPHSHNPDYLVNWNNKPAPGYTSGYGTGSVHRGDLLDARVAALLDEGHEFTTASLTQLVVEAGVADLRGERVLPELLRVLESEPIDDPEVAAVVEELRTWAEDGALRREAEKGDGEYRHADAIRIMDAWWPLLVEAQFEPGLGGDLFEQLSGAVPVDEAPAHNDHTGSAFQNGWWSYVHKDLRSVLGDDVSAPLGTAYCGDGDLGECRSLLLDALETAAATPASEVYPGDEECAAGDQFCADSIIHAPLGGIGMPATAWQNRPTYHLAVEFPQRRGSEGAGGG